MLSEQVSERTMIKLTIRTIGVAVLWFIMLSSALAACSSNCCEKMGGIHYCDSSAGRYVCRNGDYSACYCTRHAVMDLQLLSGCCLWQGGVFKINEFGVVVCNNGSVSEICTLQTPNESTAIY